MNTLEKELLNALEVAANTLADTLDTYHHLFLVSDDGHESIRYGEKHVSATLDVVRAAITEATKLCSKEQPDACKGCHHWEQDTTGVCTSGEIPDNDDCSYEKCSPTHRLSKQTIEALRKLNDWTPKNRLKTTAVLEVMSLINALVVTIYPGDIANFMQCEGCYFWYNGRCKDGHAPNNDDCVFTDESTIDDHELYLSEAILDKLRNPVESDDLLANTEDDNVQEPVDKRISSRWKAQLTHSLEAMRLHVFDLSQGPPGWLLNIDKPSGLIIDYLDALDAVHGDNKSTSTWPTDLDVDALANALYNVSDELSIEEAFKMLHAFIARNKEKRDRDTK